jgi:hypothetical protein
VGAVFNKTYQLRAVQSAGGGHKLATKALLRLPAPWRPFVTVAAIAEEFYRPKHRPQQIVRKSTPDPDRPLFDLFPEAYS